MWCHALRTHAHISCTSGFLEGCFGGPSGEPWNWLDAAASANQGFWLRVAGLTILSQQKGLTSEVSFGAWPGDFFALEYCDLENSPEHTFSLSFSILSLSFFHAHESTSLTTRIWREDQEIAQVREELQNAQSGSQGTVGRLPSEGSLKTFRIIFSVFARGVTCLLFCSPLGLLKLQDRPNITFSSEIFCIALLGGNEGTSQTACRARNSWDSGMVSIPGRTDVLVLYQIGRIFQ